jgi:FtsP/CotA-like multicopper oxidase with cupredoxin domain
VQPFCKVERKKYRFRFLNGSNARFYELELSSGSFLQIGNDSWLLPQAIPKQTLKLAPAQRADVIIDFRNAPSEVFLSNILIQESGRGPKKVKRPGTPLIKFLVQSGTPVDNATIAPGQALRPHRAIRAAEIVKTRRFEFERRHGAWQINHRFLDPNRDDATPKLGTAERWILKNGGGGWWHPIHMHLEAHQIQRINGKPPPLVDSFKKDTTTLAPDDEIEIFMKFRTFPGKFMFHCHNIEHEDMRMMGVFNVVP